MDLITVFCIALGLAMDAFAVALANGMALPRLKLKNCLKFGLFFGTAQALMPILGFWLAQHFLWRIVGTAHLISFALLVFIGLHMIWESLHKEKDGPIRVDISNKTVFLLAIATSIDAMAAGVGFALFGLDILMPAFVIGLTSFLLSTAAVFLGNKLGDLLQKSAEIFGGGLLVAMGIKILLETLWHR